MGSGKRLTVALALLLAVLAAPVSGCSAGSERPETGGSGEQSAAREEENRIQVRQIAEGQRGPSEREMVVASSAAELARATGLRVPDSGEGLYVSAHPGERPTGGYRVALSEAGEGGIRVVVREPGEGDIVTQALTQPYAVAVVGSGEGQHPEAGELSFVDATGRPLEWPVRRVG